MAIGPEIIIFLGIVALIGGGGYALGTGKIGSKPANTPQTATATTETSESAADTVDRAATSDEPSLLKNAILGVFVTTVSYFIPVLQAIAPLFGAGVAGYLQKQGAGGGVKVGAVHGFIMVIPAILLSAVASSLLADIPVIGGLLAGSTIIIAVVIVLHSIVLGMFGGLFGGIFSG